MDFLSLVDVEKVLGVAVQYISDPEVMNFLGFILGPDFKEIIWELESIEEFNEVISCIIYYKNLKNSIVHHYLAHILY